MIKTQGDLLRMLSKRFPDWSHHFVNAPSNGGSVWCAGAVDSPSEPRRSVCEVAPSLAALTHKIIERLDH